MNIQEFRRDMDTVFLTCSRWRDVFNSPLPEWIECEHDNKLEALKAIASKDKVAQEELTYYILKMEVFICLMHTFNHSANDIFNSLKKEGLI